MRLHPYLLVLWLLVTAALFGLFIVFHEKAIYKARIMQVEQDKELADMREDMGFASGFWLGTRVATNPLAFDSNGLLQISNLGEILRQAHYHEFRPWDERDKRRIRQMEAAAAMYGAYYSSYPSNAPVRNLPVRRRYKQPASATNAP